MFDRFRLWSQQWFNDSEVEKSHKNHTFFPNNVSLGSSAIVKVPEQVGAAKIPLRKVPRFPVPKQGSQAGFAKVPRKKFPGERFPARGSQARFLSKVQEVPKNSQEEVLKQGSQRFRSQKFTKVPKSGFPSNLPKQGSQRFPSKASKVARNRIPKIFKGSRAQVPQDFQMFSGTDSQARFPRFPGRGSDARFPSKVLRKRFPGFPKVRKNRFRSKVPKSRFPSQVPKQGSQEQVITRSRFAKIPNGSQEQVPKQGSQEQVPKQGYHARFPRIGVQEQVPRNRFPGTGSQASLPSKSSEANPRNRFASKVSSVQEKFWLFPTDGQ